MNIVLAKFVPALPPRNGHIGSTTFEDGAEFFNLPRRDDGIQPPRTDRPCLQQLLAARFAATIAATQGELSRATEAISKMCRDPTVSDRQKSSNAALGDAEVGAPRQQTHVNRDVEAFPDEVRPQRSERFLGTNPSIVLQPREAEALQGRH